MDKADYLGFGQMGLYDAQLVVISVESDAVRDTVRVQPRFAQAEIGGLCLIGARGEYWDKLTPDYADLIRQRCAWNDRNGGKTVWPISVDSA
jgi:hypothetical protein